MINWNWSKLKYLLFERHSQEFESQATDQEKIFVNKNLQTSIIRKQTIQLLKNVFSHFILPKKIYNGI